MSLVSVEKIAVLKLAPTIVEMLVGATTEHVSVIPNTQGLTAKFIKKMSTCRSNVLSIVFMDVLESVPMFTLTTVLVHPASAMCNAHENACQHVLDPTERTEPFPSLRMPVQKASNRFLGWSTE